MKNIKRLTVVLATVLAGLPVATQADEAPRPNILFIIADDQSPFDLKLYNPNSTLETPNIDRLAVEGMVFDAARCIPHGGLGGWRLYAFAAHDHERSLGLAHPRSGEVRPESQLA